MEIETLEHHNLTSLISSDDTERCTVQEQEFAEKKEKKMAKITQAEQQHAPAIC